MADPLPPRPVRPLAALALLGVGALLAGCAASARPQASVPPRAPGRHAAGAAGTAVPPKDRDQGRDRRLPGPAPTQPAPVRVLAVAYSAPTPAAPLGRAEAAPRAGTAGRRPHPAPGRPAAPLPQRPPDRAAAPRGLPQIDVCALGQHYGGWPRGGPQQAACRAVYG
jgi:hypothetical protein